MAPQQMSGMQGVPHPQYPGRMMGGAMMPNGAMEHGNPDLAKQQNPMARRMMIPNMGR